MKIRSFVTSIIMAALIMPAFVACKKGPNDPSISLKSRTSRLCGEWSITKATETDQSGTTTVTTSYNNGTITISQGSNAITGTYSWTYSINKDGTWTAKQSITIAGNTTISEVEGTWFWAGANKDAEIKNKEMIMMRINKEKITAGTTTDIYTYKGDDLRGYLIDQLKSKEMVWKYKNVYTGTTTDSFTQELTFTKD